ncbi:MAG: hypothetical protein C7B46_16600 [Sulfobacillus benefaciens]|uniref:PD-(D/E)XK endonuclease-like domain-containing protein n=1 Tax=Sulfobacillus benefaciens TaxID=453960 RepID=A0A2T2XAV0_9FIRM|nr:MAG: hypothetical protein C7B46_16600 [Sulfobacillus benefaciens]
MTMPTVTVHRGTPQQMLSAWVDRMQSHRAETPLSLIEIVVPNTALVHWLKTITPLVNVRVVTWSEWFFRHFPSKLVWPDDADHVLEQALPQSLRVPALRQVPGFYLTVIRYALECRNANISQEILGDANPLLLDVISWLADRAFAHNVYDSFRLYQYAMSSAEVFHFQETSLIFWGFGPWMPWQWHLVRVIARYQPVEVYHMSSNAEEILPKALESASIQVPVEYHAPEAVARLIAQRIAAGVDPKDIVVVSSDSTTHDRIETACHGYRIPVANAHSRHTLLQETWHALINGPSQPWSWRRLQSLYPAVKEWMTHWRQRMETTQEWIQALDLVTEAIRQMHLPQALGTIAQKRFVAFAEVLPQPSGDLINKELWDLPNHVTWPLSGGQGVWIVEAKEFPGMVAKELILTAEPRHRGAGTLAEDILGPRAADSLRLLRDHPYLDASWWATERIYRIGCDVGDPWDMLPRLPWSQSAATSSSWYRHWREDTTFNEHSGNLGRNIGNLVPRQLSASQLEEFGSCPLSFFYDRVLRLSTRDVDPWKQLPSLYGQWAHLALYHWEHNPDQTIADAVDRAMAEIPGPKELLPAAYRQSRYRLIDNLTHVLQDMQDRASPITVEVEKEISWDLIDSWKIRMRLDRVEHYHNYDMIVDFKTGQVEHPEKIQPDQLQVPIYISAWQEQTRNDQKIITGAYWGISDRNQFRRREVVATEGLTDAVRDLISGILLRIEEGKFYPVPEAQKDPCRLCDYRLICPSNIKPLARRKYLHHPEFLGLWSNNEVSSGE